MISEIILVFLKQCFSSSQIYQAPIFPRFLPYLLDPSLIYQFQFQTVRCDDQYEYKDVKFEKTHGEVLINSTKSGKKEFVDRLQEKVKNVIDRGRQMLKMASQAISRGFDNFKIKMKGITGNKQPDTRTFVSSTSIHLSPPSRFAPPSKSEPEHSSSKQSIKYDDTYFQVINP